MHPKQQRLLIILSLITLALVAIVLWVKPPEKKSDAPQKSDPTTPVFEKLERDRITRLEIQHGASASKLVFTKVDGKWRMSAPLQENADSRKVGDLVNRLVNLQAGTPIPVDDPAPFGLAPAPNILVRFSGEDIEERTLQIGSEAAVGFATYVRVGDTGPILAANGRFSQDFSRTADDFRDRTVWAFSEGQADRVHWTWNPPPLPAGTPATAPPSPEAEDDLGLEDPARPPAQLALPTQPIDALLRKDDHGWWVGDSGHRADDQKVEAFLREALDLRIKSFQEPDQLTAPGVGKMEVTSGGGLHTLELFPATGEAWPARIPLREQGVMLEKNVEKVLSRDPVSFFATKLIPVRRFTVDRLNVVLGDISFEATKSEGKWSRSSADDLLDALQDATASRAVEPPAAPEAPWGRIELFEGESRKESVILGAERSDGTHLVSDQAGGPAFIIGASLVDDLRRAARSEAQKLQEAVEVGDPEDL